MTPPEDTDASINSLRDQLVGTWELISWEQIGADGTRRQLFGANPKGIAVFDTGGRYIISVMRADRAKLGIETFSQIANATAEESKATVQGTMTYFGTYAVSESDPVISIHIEACSFPNWNGTRQKRLFAIRNDRLALAFRPPRGNKVDVLWKRAGS